METEYASKSQANTATWLGGLGLGGAVLNGIMNHVNGYGGRFGSEAAMAGAAGLGVLAEKDGKIAELTAERYTNGAVSELAKVNFTRDREIEGRLASVEATQKAEAAAFVEYRNSQKENQELREKLMEQRITTVAATAATAATALQGEIARLGGVVASITRISVPNTAICPGWGQVTVTPVTPATPAVAASGRRPP